MDADEGWSAFRAICARPSCRNKEVKVDCQRCQLSRKGPSYVAQQDTRTLVVEDDKNDPYPHLGSDPYNKPDGGKEPRLFSKHPVKSLIAPEDKFVGDEVNIQIDGSGDLGILIETFLSVPQGSETKYNFYIDESDEETTARMFAVLVMANSGNHYVQSAEAILHYWYSAFLPDWVVIILERQVQNALSEIQAKIPFASGDESINYYKDCGNIDDSTTKVFEAWFSPEFARSHLANYAHRSMLHQGRASLQRANNIHDRRDDIGKELSDRWIPPKWRSSRMGYLKTGVLLPITASKDEFKYPNPAFFPNWDRCQDYGFDPMEAWANMYKHPKRSNVPTDDFHGNFFFFMREKLLRFFVALDRVKNYKITVSSHRPPGASINWNMRWATGPSVKVIRLDTLDVDDLGDISVIKDFQGMINACHGRTKSGSSQATIVAERPEDHAEQVVEATDNHTEQVVDVPDDHERGDQEQQRAEQANKKRLKKLEKRKAAKAKKKSQAAASKSANEAPKDSNQDGGLGKTATHTPGSVSDTTTGSSGVVFTPSSSSAASERSQRLHEHFPPLSPAEEKEPGQDEQERGQEGVACTPTALVHDQFEAASPEDTEEQWVTVTKKQKPKKVGNRIHSKGQHTPAPTNSLRRSVSTKSVTSSPLSINANAVPGQQALTMGRKYRESRTAYSSPSCGGVDFWGNYRDDSVSTPDEKGLEHTEPEANASPNSQPSPVELPRLPNPVPLDGPTLGLWTETPEQETEALSQQVPEKPIQEAPEELVQTAPEYPAQEASDTTTDAPSNGDEVIVQLPSVSQGIMDTQAPIVIPSRDPYDYSNVPLIRYPEPVRNDTNPNERVIYKSITYRYGRKRATITATVTFPPEPTDNAGSECGEGQSGSSRSADQTAERPDETGPALDPVADSAANPLSDQGTEQPAKTNPVVDPVADSHTATSGNDDVEKQGTIIETAASNDANTVTEAPVADSVADNDTANHANVSGNDDVEDQDQHTVVETATTNEANTVTNALAAEPKLTKAQKKNEKRKKDKAKAKERAKAKKTKIQAASQTQATADTADNTAAQAEMVSGSGAGQASVELPNPASGLDILATAAAIIKQDAARSETGQVSTIPEQPASSEPIDQVDSSPETPQLPASPPPSSVTASDSPATPEPRFLENGTRIREGYTVDDLTDMEKGCSLT
ncbi:hypothetical protein PG984_006342 [Apiospora sp. TS-2023a]